MVCPHNGIQLRKIKNKNQKKPEEEKQEEKHKTTQNVDAKNRDTQKTMHNGWFSLYRIQELAKLIYNDRS